MKTKTRTLAMLILMVLLAVMTVPVSGSADGNSAPYFTLTEGNLTGNAVQMHYTTSSQWTDGSTVIIDSYTYQNLDSGFVRFTLTYTAPAGFEICVFNPVDGDKVHIFATGKTIAEKATLVFDLDSKTLAGLNALNVTFFKKKEDGDPGQFFIIGDLSQSAGEDPAVMPTTDGTPYGKQSATEYYPINLWTDGRAVTTDSLTVQELSNGYRRFRCVYTAPKGCRIVAFNPPDADRFKLFGSGTTSGAKSSFDFDVAETHLSAIDDITIRFWVEGETDGSYQIVIKTESLPKHVHLPVVDPEVPATCTETGLKEGSHCSACNAILKKQEVIPALGHTEVTDAGKAATCTETGLTEGKHCSVCHVVLAAQEVIPAAGHTEVADAGVDATCTTAGKTAGKHCSVCNTVLVAQQEIAALGHEWDDGAVTKEATYTDDGIKTFTCKRCGETREEAIIMTRIPLGQTGWVSNTDGSWSYGNAAGDAAVGPATIEGTAYCFNEQGKMITGWAEVGGKWYYADTSGKLYRGWKEVGKIWYYFRADGEMATGWVNDGGTYYYMKADGSMATGWVEDNGKWYYMDKGGAMKTGWMKDGKNWYLLKSGGEMATGWTKDGGTWYYFTSSGVMKTGWYEEKESDGTSSWYWFDKDGSMATGWKEIDKKWEFFSDSGVWQYTWNGK